MAEDTEEEEDEDSGSKQMQQVIIMSLTENVFFRRHFVISHTDFAE